MVSTQDILNAKMAARDQRIRELTTQIEKEKAEAKVAAECQRQEAIRKAEVEATAKWEESDAAKREEEAAKKARVEIRKGKWKADGPPAELSSARVVGRASCTLCVAAGQPYIPQPVYSCKELCSAGNDCVF
jgi:hypothetical protein